MRVLLQCKYTASLLLRVCSHINIYPYIHTHIHIYTYICTFTYNYIHGEGGAGVEGGAKERGGRGWGSGEERKGGGLPH